MIEQTKSQLSSMQILGMAKALDLRLQEAINHSWGPIEFLSALTSDEKSYREVRQIQRRLRNASFRTDASFENWDYQAKRNLNKSTVRELMQLSFIKASPRNVLVTGATGVGKTFIATSIGNQACRHGYTTQFLGISVFTEKFLIARTDSTYMRLREKLIKVDLLIIDDIGLKKLQAPIVQDLHDILEERQDKCTLITTQLPLKNWNEIITDELALDTIVDKLKHGSLNLVIEGESYRKKKGKTETLDSKLVPVEIAPN